MATNDVNVELGAGDSIGRTFQILLDCKEKGRDLHNQRLPSIYMVPRRYRDLSPRSFNPSVVSIGPLHRQDTNLQKFEVQKATYLHRLLERSGPNPEETLKECVQKVSAQIKRIKACYAEAMVYNDEELATMMVVDGCFILYFIHLLSLEEGPLKDKRLVASTMVFDLVLIENQLPFFVLKDIFESTIRKFKPNTSLNNHIKKLFRWYGFFKDNVESSIPDLDTTHDHILGFLHDSLKPAYDIPTEYIQYTKGHSAVDLDRAGVNFRPNQDANWAMAMKVELPRFSFFPWFWCKPTLRMPILYAHDFTEMILRNLVIYERSSPVFEYVVSYVYAMDMLIDTTDDVARLVKSGVLVNGLGSTEAAANMINNILTEVQLPEFLYQKEWQQLDNYYNSYWPNAAAKLKRTYFSSPWNVIALFAGLVLFVLTVVQTIFTIKAANPIIVTKQ